MNNQYQKRIFVLKERCNGCRICELRCSFYHHQVYSPSLSRIYVEKNEIEGYTNPKTCVNCGKCIDACPEEAISRSETTGAILISPELCKGHQNCVEVCPFHVMRFDAGRKIAYTCDLCDGNPQCVKYCPEKALFYITSKEFKEMREKEMNRLKSGEKDKPSVVPQE